MNTMEEFTLAFHFPNGYVLPEKGSVEVSLQDLSDSSMPSTIAAWGSNKIPQQPWRMQFRIAEHSHKPAGPNHSVSVSIRQDDGTLLVNDNKLLVISPGKEQDVYLSPRGYLHVEYLIRTREGRPAGTTWTAKLHEADNREAVIGQAIARFEDNGVYINYDRCLVVAGKKYSVSGTENSSRHEKRIRLRPRDVVLKAITPSIEFGG
ncbi:hypothetical protein D3C76_755360 [compost metagenome]